MGFLFKENEDMLTSLLRKQVNELNNIIHDVEEGRPLREYTVENLKQVEQQIKWIRKQIRWFKEFYVEN